MGTDPWPPPRISMSDAPAFWPDRSVCGDPARESRTQRAAVYVIPTLLRELINPFPAYINLVSKVYAHYFAA